MPTPRPVVPCPDPSHSEACDCKTVAPNFAAAERVLSGDWDENGTTTVTLPAATVEVLLHSRGWQFEHVRGGIAYVKPGGKLRSAGGKFGTDYLWERDDALRLALVAEVVR